MKIEFWMIGKTSFDYISDGEHLYLKRIKKYLPFERVVIPDLKNTKKLSVRQIKEKEATEILKKLQGGDYLILLDESGKSYSSVKFSRHIEKLLHQSARKLIFLVGGAYGFDEKVYQRAQEKISLSEMTFSHQMIRLFLLEQFYRAMTILKNEPYHNE